MFLVGGTNLFLPEALASKDFLQGYLIIASPTKPNRSSAAPHRTLYDEKNTFPARSGLNKAICFCCQIVSNSRQHTVYTYKYTYSIAATPQDFQW